jgi:hypothetical protein
MDIQLKLSLFFVCLFVCLFAPTFQVRERLQQAINQIHLRFVHRNSHVRNIPDAPYILDTSVGTCPMIKKHQEVTQMAAPVPSMLDIRIIKAWGHVDMSSVYQTQFPVASGAAIEMNKRMKPRVPEESVLCGCSSVTHVPVELRVSFFRSCVVVVSLF